MPHGKSELGKCYNTGFRYAYVEMPSPLLFGFNINENFANNPLS